MMGLGGTVANLTVEEVVREAVADAASSKVRALKVVVDPKKESLALAASVPEGGSLAEDFSAVAGALEDGVPCMVLIRMAADADWALLAWTPSDSPVKLRTLCAGSRKTLRDAFSELSFKEYSTTERDEVTFEQFQEHTKTLTESERHAAMTQGEIDQEEALKQSHKEQAAAPKRLAGMVALQIEVREPFKAALRQLVAEEAGAVIGHLAGAKGEELDGEVLEGVSRPSQLKGRLPAEEPCYVLLRLATEAKGLLLISWLPDGAAVKAKMKCSTFKASVLSLARDLAEVERVAQKEINDEDDLVDELASPPTAEAGASAEADAPAAPAPGGFRPPPGAVAMPGMGGPPGGFRLPAMGGGMPALKKTGGPLP
mmetsp:Transcript_104988/g.293028  ORF Transcript_104988/g.293028 Transcript_104988/m.293028 type:complete len:371 (-) Transcript_104988:80-1192(-)